MLSRPCLLKQQQQQTNKQTNKQQQRSEVVMIYEEDTRVYFFLIFIGITKINIGISVQQKCRGYTVYTVCNKQEIYIL